MNNYKEYKYKNYTLVLYGKSSMAIYEDGKERIHTGSRNQAAMPTNQEEAEKFIESTIRMIDRMFEVDIKEIQGDK